MQRWHGLDEIPADWAGCVATIGDFDGVHRGHQRIIARAKALGSERNLPTVLITFTPHPAGVVRKGGHPPILTTDARRAELVEQLGVDVMLLVPFTHKFSRLSAEEFAHEVLVADLHAEVVVVGDNFRFGHGAAGDITTLTRFGEQWGFSTEALPLLSEEGHPISSTHIRACVGAGNLAEATEALGRPHRLDGAVVHGEKRGRDLGFPTANVRVSAHAAIPADGVYAGRVVQLDSTGATMQDGPVRIAAISVGTNPTFDGDHLTIEAYVLDFDGDLYGQCLGVEFVHKLRDMVKFTTIEALVEQMHADVEQTRALMS